MIQNEISRENRIFVLSLILIITFSLFVGNNCFSQNINFDNTSNIKLIKLKNNDSVIVNILNIDKELTKVIDINNDIYNIPNERIFKIIDITQVNIDSLKRSFKITKEEKNNSKLVVVNQESLSKDTNIIDIYNQYSAINSDLGLSFNSLKYKSVSFGSTLNFTFSFGFIYKYYLAEYQYNSFNVFREDIPSTLHYESPSYLHLESHNIIIGLKYDLPILFFSVYTGLNYSKGILSGRKLSETENSWHIKSYIFGSEPVDQTNSIFGFTAYLKLFKYVHLGYKYNIIFGNSFDQTHSDYSIRLIINLNRDKYEKPKQFEDSNSSPNILSFP